MNIKTDGIITLAYILLNEPADPNLKCPLEISDIVNFVEAEAGEDVMYFASSAQDRGDTEIVSADANGELTYAKIPLKTTTTLSFSGLQSGLETVLLNEIVNSKDVSALASKKAGIIRSMNQIEMKNILALCLAVASQEVNKTTGMDLLDTIVLLKQKISKFSSDYILLVADDVANAIDTYDIDNKSSYNYRLGIQESIKALGINKIVRIVGEDGSGNPILADGKAILVGRNSEIAQNGKPLTLARRKFTKEVAEYSGAEDGASRLVSIASVPLVHGHELGYAVYGYESVVQVLTQYRCVSFCDDIIA
ncbi:MAG: hypothetical protein WC543_00120 [Candidatus Omnitrophota bacterium]